MTSKPLVKRTFATLRSAEFGFFGVVVYTRVQTPRFCGLPCSAGTLFRFGLNPRGLRISWLIVGIQTFHCSAAFAAKHVKQGAWAFRPAPARGGPEDIAPGRARYASILASGQRFARERRGTACLGSAAIYSGNSGRSR